MKTRITAAVAAVLLSSLAASPDDALAYGTVTLEEAGLENAEASDTVPGAQAAYYADEE